MKALLLLYTQSIMKYLLDVQLDLQAGNLAC